MFESARGEQLSMRTGSPEVVSMLAQVDSALAGRITQPSAKMSPGIAFVLQISQLTLNNCDLVTRNEDTLALTL